MNSKDLNVDVMVIGCGPAGIGAAIAIKEHNPDKKVVIVETGRISSRRHCPVDSGFLCKGCGGVCNVISGFGGSIHHGDGLKLSKFPSGRRIANLVSNISQLEKEALEILKKENSIFSIPESETTLSLKRYPVISLPQEQVAIMLDDLNTLISQLGISVSYLTEVHKIELEEDGFTIAVRDALSHKPLASYKAKNVVVATGRKGLHWWRNEIRKLNIKYEEPVTSMGIRVEGPTYLFQDAAKNHLDYKCSFTRDDKKFKTFCFCSGNGGGRIKLVDYGQWCLLDGHVTPDDKNNTVSNFALLMQLFSNKPNQSSFDWVMENIIPRYKHLNPSRPGKPIIQRLNSFLAKKTELHSSEFRTFIQSSLHEVSPGNVHELFPEEMQDDFIGALKEVLNSISLYSSNPGTALQEMYEKSHVIGLELENLWDRIDLTEYMETNIPNLYCCGDCAGYAQGVLQALVSGIQAGKKISTSS